MKPINDIQAVKAAYDRWLVKYQMPRMFWPYMASKVQFNDFSVVKTSESKKKTTLVTVTDELQASYWSNLQQLVRAWNPAAVGSPDDQFVLICSENEKDAQILLFTLMHQMLLGVNLAQPRYRIGVKRAYELWTLLEQDAQEAPNAVIVPTLHSDLTSAQISALRDLFTSSYRIFAATPLTPQKFFDRFNYLPSYVFYVDKVHSVKAVG